jgi:hypothetical protein
MAENLKLARLYLLLLAIAVVGRWLFGTFGVPYEKGHHVFSIVTMTLYSAIFYGAFCRRWRHFRLWRAAGLGITLGVMSSRDPRGDAPLLYPRAAHLLQQPVALGCSGRRRASQAISAASPAHRQRSSPASLPPSAGPSAGCPSLGAASFFNAPGPPSVGCGTEEDANRTTQLH